MAGGTTRRELFHGLFGLGAGLLAGASLARGGAARAALDPPAASRLARSWLGEAEAARELGALYLARHPEEADAAALLRGSLGEGPAAGAARRFDRRRRRDFAEGRSVELAGWRLSVSEARLCALLHLT